MSKEQWELLESLPEDLKVSDLPPGIMFAIADRIEAAISAASRSPLHDLSTQLAGLFNKLFRAAPIEAVNAIRRLTPGSASEDAAYMLGQISFAQLLTAQSYVRRADDNFMPTIQDRRYEKYLNALYGQDATGVELADKTGECVETVSRKLKQLRELGITDFRREGNCIINFLTPTARSVLETTGGRGDVVEQGDEPKLKLVMSLREELGDVYKFKPTFAQETSPARRKEAA